MSPPTERFDYEAKLKLIPHEPGCYLMRDKRGKIVYVGKAKDLKNRVRNYFQTSGDPRPFVAALPRVLGDIETIITANEKEALILENNLIKAHKPRYNVQLKDDKNFLSLRIDRGKKWPRVEVVRKQKKNDKAKYFGPYHSAKSIRQTLNLLNKYFQLRTCPDHVLKNRSRPCLQYQIKRCPGPCVFDIDPDDYRRNVDEAVMFLEGRGDELVDTIEERMYRASKREEFELAAHYRDQMRSIERVLQRQLAVSTEWIDRDILGFYREGDRVSIEVMFVRKGRLEGARSFGFKDQEFPDEEVLSSFLNLFYASGNFVPKEVLLPFELPDDESEVFEELLGEMKGQKVTVHVPQRGQKAALVKTADTNAEHAFEEEHSEEERASDTLEKLQRALKLRTFPQRIECYDISNLQGKQIVGSMVVFEDGEPAKEEYRHYKMKEVTSQDDFASMREMLGRRFARVADGDGPAPDLVVIDGGKGQLSQAVHILEDLGLHDLEVVSLAKARVDRVGYRDPEVTRSRERVFKPNRKNPILLNENSAELYLLERLRDEAHRFAITFHKNLRRKETLKSSLDDVPGVGKKTRTALLQHFGNLRRIKRASVEELQEVEGIGARTAEEIFVFFNGVRPEQEHRGEDLTK